MKWMVAAVGRLKEPYYQEAVDSYLDRLRHYRSVSMIEVAEEPSGGNTPARARGRESDCLRKLVKGSKVVALTERGQAVTTEGLAARLEAFEGQGPGLAFVIGGPDGLDPGLEADADWQLALSALTLPYQLARLVLVEQLYRAETIRRGEPYHRGGRS